MRSRARFVASPQPLSRNVDAHGESCEEAWSGHAWEREELLDWIEGQEGLEGVVFLTGDLHQVGVYALRESIAEISASPFDASGQVSNHAKGGEDVTFFERWGSNMAFAKVEMGAEELKVEVYQGGGTILGELGIVALYVACGLGLFWVGGGGGGGKGKGGKGLAIGGVLVVAVVVVAVLDATGGAAGMDEPVFRCTIAASGELSVVKDN